MPCSLRREPGHSAHLCAYCKHADLDWEDFPCNLCTPNPVKIRVCFWEAK